MIDILSPLAPVAAVVLNAMATAMDPPPPVDLVKWARVNVKFTRDESPLPGDFDDALFPFYRDIFTALSPDHEAREVTLRGSAQGGKTVIAQVFVVGGMDLAPANTLYIHPTLENAQKWSKTKFEKMRANSKATQRIFGKGRARDDKDTVLYKETLDGRGYLQLAGANSPSALSMITTPRMVLDDLAKWPLDGIEEAGDAETMALSRASAFDEAKILRVSTALVSGSCRITDAWERGTRQVFEVPCPHCETYQPLEWENFRRSLETEDPDAPLPDPQKAHFTCDDCGAAIEHRHKRSIVARGRWKALNPKGDHPSFHIWRAYMPTRDWASIATEWHQARGIAQGDDPTKSGKAKSEQVFYNDVLGLPYAKGSNAPPWEALRNRGAESERDAGRIPAGYPLTTAGIDCQPDRLEVLVKVWGRDARSAIVQKILIPHGISTPEGRAALDALVKTSRWRNAAGRDRKIDLTVIDEGNETEDVLAWARRFPRTSVITVKGGRGDTGPLTAFQKGTGKHAEQRKRPDKKRIIANVSRLKAWLYADLRREDPLDRGYLDLPRGLEDDFYVQLTAERRVTSRSSSGVSTNRWVPIEGRRNEMLDCAVYARVGALIIRWRSLSDADWDRLEEEADAPMAVADLFDAANTAPPAPVKPVRQLWEIA